MDEAMQQALERDRTIDITTTGRNTGRNCSVSPPLGRGRVREGVVSSSRFPSSNYAAARRDTPFLALPLRGEGTPAILNSYYRAAPAQGDLVP